MAARVRVRDYSEILDSVAIALSSCNKDLHQQNGWRGL